LRQPLEDKTITISRAQGSLSFPASFQLVGAMNPCPCGWFGDSQHECTLEKQLGERTAQLLLGSEDKTIIIDLGWNLVTKKRSERAMATREVVLSN
jgi:magnesium chelatase family protein